MSDMVCRKSMMRCQTPGMCSPHGGCRDEVTTAKDRQISALIAENERVKARLCVCRDCGGQGEVYSGHSSYQGHNQPPEPDMDVCGTCGGDGVLGPLEDFEALADERDQLKADNEALRDGANFRAIQSLRQDCDALRKDAEIGRLAFQFFDRMDDPADCDPLEKSTGEFLRAVSAAMGKGEQS